MELVHQLEQNLSQQQLQSLNLLQMNETALEQFIHAQALENPVMDTEDYSPPIQEDRHFTKQLERLEWLRNTDYQNRSYYPEEVERDPLALAAGWGGLEETLEKYLNNQIDALSLGEEDRMLLRFLTGELDEDGYLRESPDVLALACGLPQEKVESAIVRLQQMEPAGVGARSLSERLRLQLVRRKGSETAIRIVQDYLEDLAHSRFRRIEAALKTDRTHVLQAQTEILALQPHIGSLFESREETVYIQPDVYIEENGEKLTARMAREGHPFFHVNQYYLTLYRTTEDPEVRSYLKEKISQADGLLYFINQRENTILRLVELIMKKQWSFFREGEATLAPFTMAEAAQLLGIHPSTVTRAVKNKYVQCPKGIYPLRYFFEKGTGATGMAEIGSRQVKARIRQLIQGEDPARPLSDQRISEQLKAEGCDISRRTVAKYREEMHLTGSAERRRS